VTRLMREQGVVGPDHEPSDEEVRRFDKKRPGKNVSNDDWRSPGDPDARIARMKDGRTHLAYKAEHVVDLKNDLVLAAEVYPADRADTATPPGGSCCRLLQEVRQVPWDAELLLAFRQSEPSCGVFSGLVGP